MTTRRRWLVKYLKQYDVLTKKKQSLSSGRQDNGIATNLLQFNGQFNQLHIGKAVMAYGILDTSFWWPPFASDISPVPPTHAARFPEWGRASMCGRKAQGTLPQRPDPWACPLCRWMGCLLLSINFVFPKFWRQTKLKTTNQSWLSCADGKHPITKLKWKCTKNCQISIYPIFFIVCVMFCFVSQPSNIGFFLSGEETFENCFLCRQTGCPHASQLVKIAVASGCNRPQKLQAPPNYTPTCYLWLK